MLYVGIFSVLYGISSSLTGIKHNVSILITLTVTSHILRYKPLTVFLHFLIIILLLEQKYRNHLLVDNQSRGIGTISAQGEKMAARNRGHGGAHIL